MEMEVRSTGGDQVKPIELTAEHLAAAARHRRIVVNLDTGWGLPGVEDLDPVEFVDAHTDYLTGMDASQVDSIWWCWGDMNYAPYPSKILPVNHAYQRWCQQGMDPLPICIDRTREKEVEAFCSFRPNESGAGGEGTGNPDNWGVWPVIEKSPHWGQPSPFWPAPFQHFNFAVEEVRRYKLAIIREVVENYDFDGIEIDWRCGYGCLPFHHKWEHRDHLTAFMRSVREMLQEVGEQRGRPLLLATRVPENVEGCHWDGLHVERWVGENLVDMLALGCKSFEVDLDAFRRLTEGTHIGLYPSMDDHHRAGGYEQPTIELYRGVAATFLQQGADGIYAFNWYPVPAILDSRAHPRQEQLRRQALCEMGSLDTLRHKDKVFATQRRGGGGWPESAEFFYKNTSAFAQLPKVISVAPACGDKQTGETYIAVMVGDDMDGQADRVERIQMRVLLSDPAAEGAPWDDRIHTEPVRICTLSSRDHAQPPAKDILYGLRARINGVLLDTPGIHEGWLVYDVRPVQLAHGRNIVAFRLERGSRASGARISVEKLEIHVKYL
jgi:hypothetical protein